MSCKTYLPWPRRDTTLSKQIRYKYYFAHQLSFKFCAKHHFILKMLHFTKSEHTLSLKMCSMSLLKLLKRCARRSMRGDWGESNKMAEELNLDREGLPNSTTEREIIEHYFHRGYEYKSIVLLLAKYHDIRLSERTLNRKLKDFGLKGREHVDENLEIRGRNMPRSMWHILRLRHHMNVPRQLVASIMKQVDPEGVALRKRRCLHRRTYVFPGPNFSWHVDGYDKLKPYGFSIHGCVDGFSRRVLWLQV